MEGLTHRYASGHGINGVSLRVGPGETVGIMGASGCGKTTLLKVLAGLLAAQEGSVKLDGEDRPGRVGYIPQQLGLVRSRSALDNVLMGALSRGGPRTLAGLWPSRDLSDAVALLSRMGLGDKAERPVSSLSGGERQRVAIARTLLQRPDLLLADEFTANLDVVKAGEVLDLLRDAARGGVATVVALHDVELAREYTNRVVFLREGRVVAERPGSEVTRESVREWMG